MRLSYELLESLSQKYGNSFYLLNIDKFRKNYNEFLSSFKDVYQNTKIAYSYKTNYIPALCKVIDKLGGFAEVVSEMEYDLAIKVGVKPQNIIVNGPYKPKIALEKFLLNGSLVNIDSYKEFKDIIEIAKKSKNKKLRIGFRINFSIKKLEISRFGFDINDSNLKQALKIIEDYSNITLECIHSHFPNRDIDSFKEQTLKLLSFIEDNFKEKPPKYIDIGGGFAGKMSEELAKQFKYRIPTYKEYAEIIAKEFKKKFENLEKKPTLILEPGTAVVADTMSFVCRVYSIKNIRGNYIATTSGTRFNFSNLCNDINFPLNIFSKNKDQFFDSIDFAGYTCIEGDYLYKKYKGSVSEGDFLVFDNVGSYSIVFKPPFILPNVPIIAFEKNKFFEVKRKETINDIFTTYNFDYETEESF